jgi:murein L,D-transpeptidase YafK
VTVEPGPEAFIVRRLVFLLLSVTLFLGVCNHPDIPVTERLADRIVISKSAHTMTLLADGSVLEVYQIAIGRGPAGPKTRAGDHKTPEGEYVVDAKNADSKFYLALHLSYPNAADRARARRSGVNPGGDIEIHGIEKGLGWIGALHRSFDWTDGCIAVTDPEIREVWKLAPVGTPVEIRP